MQNYVPSWGAEVHARGGWAHASAQSAKTFTMRSAPVRAAWQLAPKSKRYHKERGNKKRRAYRGQYSPNYHVPVKQTDGALRKRPPRGLIFGAQADQSLRLCYSLRASIYLVKYCVLSWFVSLLYVWLLASTGRSSQRTVLLRCLISVLFIFINKSFRN